MKCFNCGEEYDANTFFNCPRCNAPHYPSPQQSQPNFQQQQSTQPPLQYQQPIIIQQKPKKKGHGCLITILVIVGILLLLGIVGAVFGTDDNSSPSTSTSTTTTTESTENTTKKTEKNLYIFDDSQLKYKSSKIVDEDYGDKNYLIVNFEYTNTSNKTISFDWNIDAKAFQKGIELQSPISTYGIHDYDFHNTEKEIKPGATIEIQEAFEISNFKDNVTIELYDNIFAKEPKYQFDIKPKK